MAALSVVDGFLICEVTLTGFIIIYLLFCLKQLKQHWNEQYIIKRRRLSMMIWVWAIVILPIAQTINRLLQRFTSFETLPYVLSIFWIVWNFSALFIGCFAAIRLWLLYYDIQLSQSTKNRQWRMAINPDIVSKNWFLNPSNQRKFGNNGYYLLTFAFFLSLFVLCLIGASIALFKIQQLAPVLLTLYTVGQVK